MQTLCFVLLAMSSQFHAQPTSNGSELLVDSSNSSIISLPKRAHNFSKGATIAKLITFNGSGCPSNDTVRINATEWEVNVDFSQFLAKPGQVSTCELSIPIFLHGGCLAGMIQSATVSGQTNAQVNMSFNGIERNWCMRQQIKDPRAGGQANAFLYGGPLPAICGYGTKMNLSMALEAKNGPSSSGAAFNNFMIKLVNICNEEFCGNITTCSSEGEAIKPQWLLLLIPIIASMANQ